MITTKQPNTPLVIYENGERRVIAEPVKIYEAGTIEIYVPAEVAE